MTIVKLEPRSKDHDYLLVCDCGCASFKLRGDGETLCGECDSVINTEPGQTCWHKDPEDTVTVTEPFDTMAGDGPDFVERRVKERAAEDDVSFLVFGTDDGTVTSWLRQADRDEAEEQWARNQVARGLDMMFTGDGQ